MKRREFIALLSQAVVLCSVQSRAQQQPSKIYMIGYLAQARIPHLIEALQDGLRELSYVEGQNLKTEYRFPQGEAKTLDALASELVRLSPDVIVTVATPPVIAAKRATASIPIVMATAGDPVRFGIVSSLARPGGNVTGTTLYGTELSSKRLEVFREALPDITRIAVLGNARNPYGRYLWEEMQPAARALGIDLRLFMLEALDELPAAFNKMTRGDANALLVISDALFNSERRQIVQLATEHRIPTMYEGREFVEVGGLISYGPNIAAMTRRAAVFVDKVLKGAKPAELPIEQPTSFELVVNVNAAKAIGVSIAPQVVLRANEVIE